MRGTARLRTSAHPPSCACRSSALRSTTRGLASSPRSGSAPCEAGEQGACMSIAAQPLLSLNRPRVAHMARYADRVANPGDILLWHKRLARPRAPGAGAKSGAGELDADGDGDGDGLFLPADVEAPALQVENLMEEAVRGGRDGNCARSLALQRPRSLPAPLVQLAPSTLSLFDAHTLRDALSKFVAGDSSVIKSACATAPHTTTARPSFVWLCAWARRCRHRG